MLLAAHFWVEHFMSAEFHRGDLAYRPSTPHLQPAVAVHGHAFLLVALYHGLNGLRNIILDYSRIGPRAVQAITRICWPPGWRGHGGESRLSGSCDAQTGRRKSGCGHPDPRRRRRRIAGGRARARNLAPSLKIVICRKRPARSERLHAHGAGRLQLPCFNPADSLEKHFNDTIKGGSYINNQELAWTLVDEAPRAHHRAGEPRRLPVRSQPRRHDPPEAVRRPIVRSHGAQGRSHRHRDHVQPARLHPGAGHPRAAGDARPRSADATTAASAARCCCNIRTGRLIAVRARATLLATGGGATMYRISSPSLEKAGDGMAMAFRAGATFVDMEMMQFHPTGLLVGNSDRHRRTARRRAARRGRAALQRPGRALHGALRSAEAGARHARRRSRGPATWKSWRAAARRAAASTSTSAIWITISCAAVSPAWWSAAAITASTWCTIASKCRPARITRWAAWPSTWIAGRRLEGLFAAGEDAGGVHGANRLGGNGVADSIVFGGPRRRQHGLVCAVGRELPVDLGDADPRARRTLDARRSAATSGENVFELRASWRI